ncbi:7100_t:CDS:2 [Acaulospora colombiana]|uniref:7100_t:CDS:1 n=1 Tax=Acaulospora colombiana TaxID=27376 RepID=A0ACA9K307_9GLOM|nr:7100_t:CDS:2 [Acaulospora colombiana]
MGGGDLNMKKSWHPLLIKNQERVWKEEQKALEEQKKLAQLKKEKEEERQLQELRKLQEAVGGKKGPERLDWMYAAGPNQSSSAKAQEMEDFLLGKKRIDSLIDRGISLSKLSVDSKDVFIDAANPNANSYRDTQTKIREDPLLAIKKTEQANIKAIVTNPLKLKKLKERNRRSSPFRDGENSKDIINEPLSREKRSDHRFRNCRDDHRNHNGHDNNTLSMEAQRKLQEMMDNAKKLAEERKERVEKINKEEKEEEYKLVEEKKRTLGMGVHSEYLK